MQRADPKYHLCDLLILSILDCSALLNSQAFHVSLMACSLEVVMAYRVLPCMLRHNINSLSVTTKKSSEVVNHFWGTGMVQ